MLVTEIQLIVHFNAVYDLLKYVYTPCIVYLCKCVLKTKIFTIMSPQLTILCRLHFSFTDLKFFVWIEPFVYIYSGYRVKTHMDIE